MSAAIEIAGVSKVYDGGVRAVDTIEIDISQGEFFSLLGPSGCGKTTTLRMIAGFETPDVGAIRVDGDDITHVPAHKRDMGMVFQNYALFPHMSVRRNIGFGLTTQRRPRDEITRRVDEALGTVRLEPHADKLPGQLSGGQQQRVAIARAIVVGPPVVLMDEPLSNLDAKLRLEMRAEIRRIHAMLGCSTVYVTHDQEEALSLADRILVLIDGQMRQLGTPEELYSRPATPDVAEFMGYRNLLETAATPYSDGVMVSVAGAKVRGTPQAVAAGGTIDGPAVVAIRPEDLVPTSDGPIAAVVEIAEYHGRDFYAVLRCADATVLYCRSAVRVVTGETIRLAARPDRVLVYRAP
jgi:putative spermidine/putrescine transport system ATP-binding protein